QNNCRNEQIVCCTVKLHPCSGFPPSGHYIRIAGVLDECIQKVERVCLLPALLADLESRSAALGDELAVALQEHRRLSERMAVRSPNQPKTESEERKALEQEFQSSLRDVLQQLQSSPAAGQALQSWRLCESSQQLVQGLKELQGVLLAKLLTNPAEERDRSRYTQEVTLRHRDNAELVSALEAEVAAAVRDRDTEISKKNDIIRNLKSSLYHMEKGCEDFVLRTQSEAERQGQSDRKSSEGRQMRLREELAGLRTQLNSLVAANRDVEMGFRKRKYKVETEIDNWIQKYDADMSEKQSELEELSASYAKEKEELRDLEERYTILEVEFRQIVEEKRLAKERKEQEERELAIKGSAALVIQAYWRGHNVRKAVRTKSKGKKGKKVKDQNSK
uniref:Dynein regulatory complex protein 10 n=1 Tax=Scleropages formosus TaxID=113540 RepID=A0A8C9R7K1_SCLFO